MNVAEVTQGAIYSQTALWLLAVFLMGISVMAWLTVRETSLYESKAAIRNLQRKRKPHIPVRERLSWFSRVTFFLQCVLWGGGHLASINEVIEENEYDFQFRLCREIDKLVGKDVYHGQKEQLKPPTRPTSE